MILASLSKDLLPCTLSFPSHEYINYVPGRLNDEINAQYGGFI